MLGMKQEFKEAPTFKEKSTPSVEWKTKECFVVRYIPQNGILGFIFDGVPCQITTDKNKDIRGTVTVKYLGDVKSGIKFKI